MRTNYLFSGTVVWLLSLAILATIYMMWLMYPLEISYFHLENQVYLTSQTIQYNFNHLMHYLTNPLVGNLAMPDFSSSADGLHHFESVKYLFHLVQGIFLLTFPAFFFFVRDVVRKGYLALYRRAFFFLMLLPIILGSVLVLIGFDRFFVLFHQVLFVGDSTWLFDPRLDPVIWILPEEFFLHAFLLFFFLYEGLFGVFYLIGYGKGKNRCV